MSDVSQVNEKVTDSITQTNTMSLGVAPASSALPLYTSLSEATSVLYANMVATQQQNSVVGTSSLVACVDKLLSIESRTSEEGQHKMLQKVLDMLNEMDRRRSIVEAAESAVQRMVK